MHMPVAVLASCRRLLKQAPKLRRQLAVCGCIPQGVGGFKTIIVMRAPKTLLNGTVTRFLNFTCMACQNMFCRGFAYETCAGLGTLMSPRLAFSCGMHAPAEGDSMLPSAQTRLGLYFHSLTPLNSAEHCQSHERKQTCIPQPAVFEQM